MMMCRVVVNHSNLEISTLGQLLTIRELDLRYNYHKMFFFKRGKYSVIILAEVARGFEVLSVQIWAKNIGHTTGIWNILHAADHFLRAATGKLNQFLPKLDHWWTSSHGMFLENHLNAVDASFSSAIEDRYEKLIFFGWPLCGSRG